MDRDGRGGWEVENSCNRHVPRIRLSVFPGNGCENRLKSAAEQPSQTTASDFSRDILDIMHPSLHFPNGEEVRPVSLEERSG